MAIIELMRQLPADLQDLSRTARQDLAALVLRYVDNPLMQGPPITEEQQMRLDQWTYYVDSFVGASCAG